MLYSIQQKIYISIKLFSLCKYMERTIKKVYEMGYLCRLLID